MSEEDIGNAEFNDLSLRRGSLIEGRFERSTEGFESLCRDRGEQSLLVTEVPVGCGYAYPGYPGGIGQAKAFYAALIDQAEGCGNERCPQVAMVIGAGTPFCFFAGTRRDWFGGHLGLEYRPGWKMQICDGPTRYVSKFNIFSMRILRDVILINMNFWLREKRLMISDLEPDSENGFEKRSREPMTMPAERSKMAYTTSTGDFEKPSQLLTGLYLDSAALTLVGWLMVADIGVSIGGLILDPAMVDGNPAWLKPLKFAVSTALFVFSMAFVVGRLKRFRRLAGGVGLVMAVSLTIEIGLIDMQAARHVTSHFNLSTHFDAAVYQGMGAAIFIVMLSTTALWGMSFLQGFDDRSLGLAIRLGMLISLIGMGTGVLMTLPTPEQKAEMALRMPQRVGSHVVGKVDTTSRTQPGMPLTGWSTDHGDLRVAHFLALHCLQAMLLGWAAVRRKWSAARQRYLVGVIGCSGLGLYAVTLWQALRGQPLLRPDSWTWVGWALWLTLTLASLLAVGLVRRPEQSELEAIR